MDVRLTNEMKSLLEDALVAGGEQIVDCELWGCWHVTAAVDLWVAGVFELVACGRRSCRFRLTKDGAELARVVCAA